MAEEVNERWILFGYFNHIGLAEEKSGCRPANQNMCYEFKLCLHSCGLLDMGFNGFPYTWSNGRQSDTLVEQRLDRSLATDGFLSLFQHHSVTHLGKMHSDHTPLRIVWAQSKDEADKRRTKLFRFEKMWLDDHRFTACINNSWHRPNAICSEKLQVTKEALTLLDKEVGSQQKSLLKLEKTLKEAECWVQSPQNI
ncbi:Endonuclease/exonuclease/phosphatase superfamily [Sesbania bispinosa]|nr:Endonuclease/exonuclease/phosphatase superfamily [Sesbania bispinosa]